jgi:hypothetical protein
LSDAARDSTKTLHLVGEICVPAPVVVITANPV